MQLLLYSAELGTEDTKRNRVIGTVPFWTPYSSKIQNINQICKY